MGLDMYLYKKTYVKRWEHIGEENYQIQITKNGKEVDEIKPERISYIQEEVGYWRKANHIHKWFVENVQNGEDDCGDYYVEISDLTNLLNICKEIKENPSKAEVLLPTQSGFFFGDTQYDEYYFQDLDKTIEIIEGLLKEQSFDKNGRAYFLGDFYYHSSW